MNNYKGVYKSFNGNDIIISYRKDDNTLTMVGMFDYNILNDANVEYVDDRIISLDIIGGPTIYAPAIWSPLDEKETSTNLGSIDKALHGLLVTKIIINELTGVIKLKLKYDETNITAKLRIKEYRAEESLESLAV